MERWNISYVGHVWHSKNLILAILLIRFGGNPRHSVDYERAEKFRLNVIKQQLSFVFYRLTDGRRHSYRGGRPFALISISSFLSVKTVSAISNLHC